MKVRDLLKAWVGLPVANNVIITTVGNSYGDEIRCKGSIGDFVISRFDDCDVVSFSVDYCDGVNIMCVNVKSTTVPIYILRGWKLDDC